LKRNHGLAILRQREQFRDRAVAAPLKLDGRIYDAYLHEQFRDRAVAAPLKPGGIRWRARYV